MLTPNIHEIWGLTFLLGLSACSPDAGDERPGSSGGAHASSPTEASEGGANEDDGPTDDGSTGSGDDGSNADGPNDDGPNDDGPNEDGPGDDGASDDGPGDDTSSDDGPGDESTGGDGGDGGEPGICGFVECAPGDLEACPEAEKCSAWACEIGGLAFSVNSTRCVPITGDRQPGESCTRTEAGTDDCANGSFCWPNDSWTGDAGPGTCHRICVPPSQGGENSCAELGEEGTFCLAYNGGAMPLCRDRCHPLNDICTPQSEDLIARCAYEYEGFSCLEWGPGVEEVGPGERCELGVVCEDQLSCIPSWLDNSCDPAGCRGPDCGCCREICELDRPSCSDPEQACVALPGAGMPQDESGALIPLGYCR